MDDISKPHSSYRVIGVGSSCIDIVIPVDDQFLMKRISGKKGFSERIDGEAFEQILQQCASTAKIVPGGSCANTIRGLAKLGKQCGFISYRGNDSFGELFANNLKELRIMDLGETFPNHSTTRALCLVTPDGQRTIRWLNKEQKDLNLDPKVFQNISLVHLTAHLISDKNYLEQVLEQASLANSTISLSLSSFELFFKHRNKLLDLLERYVDIVFANENEIQALIELPLEESCLKLQKTCPIVVVTRGANGSILAHDDEIQMFSAFPATVVDTTGAGDLFASGFLYCFLNQYPLSTCAHIGNFLGSIAVEVMGAELPEEQWNKIYNYLNIVEKTVREEI